MAKSFDSMSRGESSQEMLAVDWALHRDLEGVVAQCFYDRCDRTVQSVLQDCDWLISITAQQLLLLIYCPAVSVQERILHYSPQILGALGHLMVQGVVQVCSGGVNGAFYEFDLGDRLRSTCESAREDDEA